jgi:hypothetical protein
MPSLAEKLAALETLSPAQLHAEWMALYQAEPPRLASKLLRQGIAYRLQQKALGKRASAPRLEVGRKASRSAPLAGSQFIRSWNGRTITVTAVTGGFEWEGQTFASLSAIARKVTGAHWSGPRFFGVSARG